MTIHKTNETKQAIARNTDRASAAEAALVAYASHMESRKLEELADSRQSSEEWIIDLLSDLRHWARGENLNFDDAVRISENHFQCELDEEADEEVDEETDDQPHTHEGTEA